MSLQGIIEEMGLGEVIQALSLNRHKGTLRIETDEGISKFFYLSEGEIVLIRTVRSEPVKIGELLLRAGKVTRDQLEAGLELQKQTGQRLGDTLVALGYVAGADVDQVVRDKFEAEFLDIFLLDRGRFEFIFGLSPETLFSPDEKLERIGLNTQSLMLEAMRRVDDWQGLLMELGSLDAVYKNGEAERPRAIEEYAFPGIALAPELRRSIYESVDSRRTIRDVLANAQEHGASRHAAFAYIHALHKQQLIRPLALDELLAAAKAALEAHDAPSTAKFLRAVMAKERIEIALVRKYVEFLKKSAKPAFARAECKQLAASYLASGETEHAVALYREALELEPHDAEVLDRLFYAYLRKSDMKEALEVGYRFRDHMSRDTDVPIVARVVKNMKELAPDDWRVIELGALLLKRQERPAEARSELERALAAAKAAGVSEDKQTRILDALLEIDPERQALAKERDRLQKQAIVAEAQARARRRLVLVLLTVLLVAVAVYGRGEYLARSELREGDRELDAATDVAGHLRALELYRAASQRVSTVSRHATAQAREVEALVQSEIAGLAARNSETIAEKKKHEDELRATRDVAEREKAVTAGLQEISSARDAQDWERVAKLSVDLFDRYGATDTRAAAVTVPIRVRSTPQGARVRVEQGPEARTPCVVEAPPRKTVHVRVSKPGYAPAISTIEATGFKDLDLHLVRGAAWKRALPAPVSGSVASGKGPSGAVLLVRTHDARAFALSPEDGSILWETPALEPAESAGDPVPGAIAQGLAIIPLRAGQVLGLEAGKGGEVWRLPPGRPVLFPPLPVTIGGQERVLLARGSGLDVLDAAAGRIDRSIELPATLAGAPSATGSRAVVALAGGRVALVDLEKGAIVWSAETKQDPAGSAAISTELGLVYVATKQATVFALGLETGNVVFPRATDVGSLEGPPTVDGQQLLLETAHGLIALDANDGHSLWEQATFGALAAPPRRFAASLYAPLKRGELVELLPSDGAPKSSTALDGQPSGPPLVSGSRLFLGAGASVLALERVEDD